MNTQLLTALCKPLAAIRPAIVDPACGDGEMLYAAANTDRAAPPPYIGTEHLLGIGPDLGLASANGLGAAGGCALRLWQARYDDPALPDLMGALNLVWDCVVTRVSNPVDAVRLWTLIHSRLSKRGEGMVLAMNAAAASAIRTGDGWGPKGLAGSRVWLEVELPSGETAFYFAADHKPNPGDLPERRAPATDLDAALELAGAFANRLRFIRGSTVEFFHHCQAQAGDRFHAAEDEWNRRKGKRKADWNILLSPEGRLVVSLTPYQKLVELSVNRVALMALHGKDPRDMVVQRPTRLALQGMVRSEELRVHAAVTAEIDRCVREYSAQRAPFTRLNDVQRLGYLDEEDSVRSTATNLGFTEGRSYKMWTASEETEKEDHRLRDDGKNEKVMVRGQELVVRVMDDEGVTRAFRQHPRDGLHEHSLTEFVQTFEIPDVPDVADCRPDRYAAIKKQLLALEQ